MNLLTYELPKHQVSRDLNEIKRDSQRRPRLLTAVEEVEVVWRRHRKAGRRGGGGRRGGDKHSDVEDDEDPFRAPSALPLYNVSAGEVRMSSRRMHLLDQLRALQAQHEEQDRLIDVLRSQKCHAQLKLEESRSYIGAWCIRRVYS